MSATNSSATVAADDGLGCAACCLIRHGDIPVLSACQLSKPCCLATSSWASAELEARGEDFGVAQMPVARQQRPDLRGNRIVSVAMPAQNELGLLPEIFEIGHGRSYG